MARFEIRPDESRVWIDGTSSVHPIRASATGLTGWFEASLRSGRALPDPAVAGELSIEVDRLRSGNGLVDRETRRRIDAGRFPTITGRVTGSERITPDRLRITGVITFRGVETPVEGEIELAQADGSGLRITGEHTFDVRSWGLEPPKIGPLKVHPEITVRIELVAVKPGA